MTRRATSSPSGPPSSATRGSWSRASGGISGDGVARHVGDVGDEQVDAARGARRAAASNRSPWCTRPPGQVPPRARDRGRVDVGGVQLGDVQDGGQRGTHRTRAAAQVDDDRPGRARATAARTSSSVRRRGTNTPGSTAIRSPQNSAQPSRCSSGRPGDAPVDQRGELAGGRRRGRRGAGPRPRRRRSRRRAAGPRRRGRRAGRSWGGDATGSRPSAGPQDGGARRPRVEP